MLARPALWIALFAAAAAPAPARDVFVDNLRGHDRNSGRLAAPQGETDGPLRTLAKALRLAASGDQIVLANTGQPYRECVGLSGARHSGTPEDRFIIQGNGAVLDGSVPVPDRAWEHVRGDVFRFRPRYLSSTQFFLDDRPATRVPAGPADEALPELAARQWCLWRGQVYFRVEPGKPPQLYRASYSYLPVGITLYHARKLAVHNLIVQGYAVDGISALDGVDDALLLSVTCRGNGRAGITLGGSSRVDLDRCTLGDNGVAQLRLFEQCRGWVFASELIGNTAPATLRLGGRLWIDGAEQAGP